MSTLTNYQNKTFKFPMNNIKKSNLKELFMKGINHNKCVFKNLINKTKGSCNIIRKMVTKLLDKEIHLNPSIY